jgi:V/A-type H+-transporting ATPase subunit I
LLSEEARKLEDEVQALTRERDRISSFGDFDPEKVRDLGQKGVRLRLYELTEEGFRNFPEDIPILILGRTKNIVRFVATFFPGDVPPQVPTVSLPSTSLSGLEKRLSEKQARLGEIHEALHSLAKNRPDLEEAVARIDEDIEFERVRHGMSEEGRLALLTGFVPDSLLGKLQAAATEHSWGLALRDPDPDDNVPTRVKNPAWIRIIQPVFDLLGTVPGYNELDISFWFLTFFTVFFAMIIGDAGYGLVLLILAVIALIRSKEGVSLGGILLMVLSLATIAWGAVTGNWFGYRGFIENTFLGNLVVPQLNSFEPRSNEWVQWITFIMGTVHITIAHVWNFINELRRKPPIRAFAQLGWLATLWGLYSLVITLVLPEAGFFQIGFYPILIGAGLAAVIIFSQQEGNFFRGVAKGFANFITTFLDGVSAFSDIISYIRLFAVGLASIEIAKSFNQMAASLGDGVVAVIAGALILLLGHSLNLAMGALSVIVHGVRLKMLEFSSHLGIEWTGIPYRPFTRVKST